MTYGDFKDLTRRTASDKILCHKAFNIAKSPKYNRYKRGFAAKFYNLFDKKTLGGTVKNENISNKESVEELHKPIIKRSNKRKVHLSYVDNIWGVDLADMQIIS